MKRFVLAVVTALMLASGGWLFAQPRPIPDSPPESDPNAVRFDYFTGPGLGGGAGFTVAGHRIFAAAGVGYVSPALSSTLPGTTPESPALFSMRFGARWIYQDLSIFPEYFHYMNITRINDFLSNEHGRGFKLGIGWSNRDTLLDIYLQNELFVGEVKLPRIPAVPTLANSANFTISLGNTLTAHTAFASLSGGFLTFLDSENTAFGLNLSFPIRLFNKALSIRPVISYANHNGGSLIKESRALGYSFGHYSGFESGRLLSLGDLILSRARFGSGLNNIALALNLEGRWYIFESHYSPLSGLFFKAFSDLAYLASGELDNGNFFFTLGGGIGYELAGFAIVLNAGYETGSGFRMTLHLSSS